MIGIACYHPLKAICIGIKENGKKNIQFLNYEPKKEENFVIGKDHKIYPKDALIEVPCGQCVGCRLDYSRQWANRCMLELEYHESSYFVTITYNDGHVPISYYGDPDTGEAIPSMTLRKRDFQLFMKRLRKRFADDHIRFFACGEYGGATFRPHYHAILFGLHLDDLKEYKKSPQGISYYNSAKLQSCWCDHDGNDMGYIVVGDVTWESCAYTARYIMKKAKGENARVYSDFNIEPEFTLMSRKPGIARQYYEDHPNLYDNLFINISTEKGGRKFCPPKYFDFLYEQDHSSEMAEIKERRKKLAIEAREIKLSKTSLSADEFLCLQERVKLGKIKSLRRNLE